MGKLRELLAAEADKYRSEKAKREQTIREWLGVLDGLFHEIDTWLKACDPEGLLDVASEPVVVNDPALGEYPVPSRRVTLGNRLVEIVPRTRYVTTTIRPPGAEKPIRAQGLVEIRHLGWATYSLYRLPDSLWCIRSSSQALYGATDAVELLDAENLEAALASMLR